MITKEFTTKRLSLTKDEREISKSWGSAWSKFGAMERSGRPIYLVFGDWSGYRSSQYRITHVEFVGNHYRNIDNKFSGTVQFSDNTTMRVWVMRVSREDIIRNKWGKNPSYTKLINDLIDSGEGYYKVLI